MKFKVVISHDIEHDGYVVDVPELVGCMSQGKTGDILQSFGEGCS